MNASEEFDKYGGCSGLTIDRLLLLRLGADLCQIATLVERVRSINGPNARLTNEFLVESALLFEKLNSMAVRHGAEPLTDDARRRLASVKVSLAPHDEQNRCYDDLTTGLAVAGEGVLLVQTLIEGIGVSSGLRELLSQLNDDYQHMGRVYRMHL